jgi:hypothetical protein
LSLKYIQYWFGKPPEDITSGDVEDFIARATPAGHNLEYAEPLAPPGELSRQISALANAEGGLLIWGVEVDREEDAKGNVLDIRPRTLRGLDAAEGGREELQRSGFEGIAPPVPGVDVRVVELPQGGVVVLLDIPQSPVGVHRAPDGRYYTRRGFLNVPMEQGQVESVRARRRRPKVLPRLEIAHIEAAEGRLILRVRLDNRGRREALNPRVRLRLLGAESLGDLPEGVEREETASGAAEEIQWITRGRVGPGALVGSWDISIHYPRDFAAEVEVACEGLPTETTYFLIPADVPPEVQSMLMGEEGWEVPPADRAEVVRLWSIDDRSPRRATPGP